ncbi:DUF1361 domain-containing protein [Paenibacillus pinistramenti]|uniref:DUF1361 domain-containing protein n=1 Tax=Paenibacillus pinistramenti TaxID=1768003 RepID=UPI001107A927|nr:DUF1361 domain-containing protein [Paenibacillus pinistramenti]
MRTKSELRYPAKWIVILVLAIISVICVKLVYDLQLASGRRPYRFIFWNVFLAWLPAAFMVLMDWALLLPAGRFRQLAASGFFVLWLVFYPNAAYLVTDLLHVFVNYPVNPEARFWTVMPFWDHLLALFLTAVLGLLLSSFTLLSIHTEVRRRLGSAAGWVFACLMLGIGSFGIYIGRFIRWNTWDLWQNPRMIARDLPDLVFAAGQRSFAAHFCIKLFMVTFIFYTALYFFGYLHADRRG